jgi:peptide/nickel transport system substrate-binding protein
MRVEPTLSRAGMPSFLAGPKIAYFDRIEWIAIPDPATA